MTINVDRLLFGHTDEASAYVVDDYPYGFRLRTKIRYWIETTKSGDRFCSQTLNPKVNGDHWNKPKKSTYSEVGVMFLNDEGHVKWTGVSLYSNEDAIVEFEAATEGKLSEAQQKKLIRLKAIKKIYSKVEFTIDTAKRTPEEQAAHDAEQAEIQTKINRAIGHEYVTEVRKAGL